MNLDMNRHQRERKLGSRGAYILAVDDYRPVLKIINKIINPQLSKENFKESEKLFAGPRWVPDTKTDY
jgi:hypothetical protein